MVISNKSNNWLLYFAYIIFDRGCIGISWYILINKKVVIWIKSKKNKLAVLEKKHKILEKRTGANERKREWWLRMWSPTMLLFDVSKAAIEKAFQETGLSKADLEDYMKDKEIGD